MLKGGDAVGRSRAEDQTFAMKVMSEDLLVKYYGKPTAF